MHPLAEGAKTLSLRIKQDLPDVLGQAGEAITVGVCPSFLHIPLVREILEQQAVLLGAQDCHSEDKGAFTGDISAEMLADSGCDFVLAGHSERRADHHESNVLVRLKAEAALRHGLHAVICVGEPLEEREGQRHLACIERQLRESLPANATREDVSIAYEPIWAIGTGRTAQLVEIDETHRHIRTLLTQLQGVQEGGTSRILYGGSVKANNALEILGLPVVDGVLVGGASLDAESFLSIIRAAAEVVAQA